MSLVDAFDPRLTLRAASATPSDSTTRVALRLLTALLDTLREGCIAAPAVGVPVRLIGLKREDVVTWLLNPELAAIGPIDLALAEDMPQTGPLRRDHWRSRTVTLTGTDLSGQVATWDLQEALAVQAQQALDLMERPDPFHWLTPFHRAMLTAREPGLRARHGAVNAGLYAAAGGVRRLEANRFALQDAAGIPRARVDGLNPMQPVDAVDRAMLSVLAMLPDLRRMIIGDPSRAGLLVSALSVQPGMAVHLGAPASDWPMDGLERMGLSSLIRPLDVPLDRFEGLPNGTGPLDAILLESAAPLRPLARALSGRGVLLVLRHTADAAWEEEAQSVFPALWRIEIPGQTDGAMLYLAQKTPMEAASARARLATRAARMGLDFLTDLLRAPMVHLRKDGVAQAL